MYNDKNPFEDHVVGSAYQRFKEHLEDSVKNGDMDHTTALQHLSTLHSFAEDKQHAQAANYIKEHSEKLGYQPKEKWFKEESWGK